MREGGRRSYPLLVILILVFFGLPGLEEAGFARRVLLEAFLSAVLVGGLYQVSGRRRTRNIGIALVVPALLASWIHVLGDVGVFLVVGRLLVAAALAHLLVHLLRHLNDTEAVSAETVSTAVSGYLVLGLLWSLLYLLVEHRSPGAFAGAAASGGGPSGFLYFSFTTMTTLGYGDIVPASRLARSLATLEAVFGQLYVAVVIARVVGLEIAARTAPKS